MRDAFGGLVNIAIIVVFMTIVSGMNNLSLEVQGLPFSEFSFS